MLGFAMFNYFRNRLRYYGIGGWLMMLASLSLPLYATMLFFNPTLPITTLYLVPSISTSATPMNLSTVPIRDVVNSFPQRIAQAIAEYKPPPSQPETSTTDHSWLVAMFSMFLMFLVASSAIQAAKKQDC